MLYTTLYCWNCNRREPSKGMFGSFISFFLNILKNKKYKENRGRTRFYLKNRDNIENTKFK